MCLAILPFLCLSGAQALSLEELLKVSNLTPKKFASFFSNFEYVYRDEVQPYEQFLATKQGDCDDYATLASYVLSKKGYHTHLIAVRMPGLVHVVCYIDEAQSYLDFNSRGYAFQTTTCKPDLPEIAKKVAKSFDAHWTSASEFTFADGLKRMVKTVVETAGYLPGPKVAMTNDSPIKMDF